MSNKVEQTKGKIEQAIGDLTGDKDLKKKGKADERAGKAKEFLDDTKDKADDLVDKVKDKLTSS
ncbi:MAG TPA: CsbD family protein [Acidimicrobiales bacterium]